VLTARSFWLVGEEVSGQRVEGARNSWTTVAQRAQILRSGRFHRML